MRAYECVYIKNNRLDIYDLFRNTCADKIFMQIVLHYKKVMSRLCAGVYLLIKIK